MTKHHYVYKSFEEKGREYIGVRSCNCLPEEDIKYFGSFKDKSFKPTKKTILFVCETREEVLEIEVELHNFFDVAVNPQFANMAKQTSTRFDRTGFTGEKHPLFGVPNSEEQKKAHSERLTGRTGALCPMYGRTGALHNSSKSIIAIQPDGTELYFGGVREASRELGIGSSRLSIKYLKTGKSPTSGKFEGWQFIYESFLSENRQVFGLLTN